MNIFIGADHRGFELKTKVAAFLAKNKYEVKDCGTFTAGVACDYPHIAYEVATQVVQSPDSRGILLCLSGIGHSIAANKVPGAYAALVYNKEAAILSRQHNDANILVIGSKFVDDKATLEIVDVWLTTPFEGGRHERRVEQIKNIEQEFMRTQKGK